MYDLKAIYEANSVNHACELLLEHPAAQVIAGGSDVLVQIREGKRAGCELVSIYGLEELRKITLEEDETLRIGPLTSFSHVTKNPLIQRIVPVLGEAADMVGGPQIRNIGTIGGNICNGVTSADTASTLFAWDALVEITSIKGVRILPIHKFYIKAGKVDLQQGEILTAILIPKQSYEGFYGVYTKYAMRNAMDIATIGCSVNVKLSPDKKTVEKARIAYGVAGPIPMRTPTPEGYAAGKSISRDMIKECAKLVLDDIMPRDSWRASKAFRCHIGEVMAQRGLEKAIQRAGGEI